MRARLLAAVRERADELLDQRGERPIAHLTPHTLRRTFASLLAEVGWRRGVRCTCWGHRPEVHDARQQVLDMGGPAPELLERVLGGTAEEAFAVWSGREVSGLKPDLAEIPPSAGWSARASKH